MFPQSSRTKQTTHGMFGWVSGTSKRAVMIIYPLTSKPRTETSNHQPGTFSTGSFSPKPPPPKTTETTTKTKNHQNHQSHQHHQTEHGRVLGADLTRKKPPPERQWPTARRWTWWRLGSGWVKPLLAGWLAFFGGCQDRFGIPF